MNSIMLTQFFSTDLIALNIKTKVGRVLAPTTMASVLMPYDSTSHVPAEEVKDVVLRCHGSGTMLNSFWIS